METSSDVTFSSTHNGRHKSADDAVQYIPAEELDEEVVAHSELWKWVDAPVFVPRKTNLPSNQTEQDTNAGESKRFLVLVCIPNSSTKLICRFHQAIMICYPINSPPVLKLIFKIRYFEGGGRSNLIEFLTNFITVCS